MPSTFLGLTIATSGLYTYHNAINVTGNNIANVQTKGYTRQEAVQKASEALRAYTTYGQIGTGVETTSIEQIRNSYYDTKFWDTNTGYGEYSTKSYYMEQIENVFNETITAGYTKAFGSFFTSLNTAAGSSLNESNLTHFVNNAQTFAEYFNDLSTNLQKIQEDTNEEIKTYTDKINGIAQQLYTLNKQINVAEIAGGTANTLRDQRALLIDELSEIVPVEVTETEIQSSLGTKMGATDYLVTICGQKLVDNDSYNQLQCVARTEKVNQSDIEGLYDVQWENGNQFNVATSNVSGKFSALFDMRDGNNADNFKGDITSVTPVDANNSKVTISSSTYDNLKQMTLNGAGTIMLHGKPYAYDSFSATYNSTTAEYEYTFNVKSDSATLSSVVGKNAAVGSSVEYYGIPYYMSQLNEFARSFAETTNSILVTGFNMSGDVGGILFTGTSPTGEEYDFSVSGTVTSVTESGGVSTVEVKPDINETATPVEKNGSVYINGVKYDYSECTYDTVAQTYNYKITGSVNSSLVGKNADNYSLVQTNTTDSYYDLTAGNLKVTSAMLKNPTSLGTTTDPINAADAGNVLNQLWKAQDDKSVLEFRGGSATQFLISITSDTGVDAEKADTFTKKYYTLLNTIKNQRLSVSGVDNDEEAVNLTKFQNAYDLSCKVVSVLQQMYDKLINETGV